MRGRNVVAGALASLCAFGCLAMVAAPASAEGLGVLERPRPDYDAKGLPLGGFRLFPTLDIGANSDDNIYSTQTATKSDVFFTVAPAIDLKSQWSRHMLELTAGSTSYLYNKHDTEDLTDWNVGGSGRLDIQRGSAAFADVGYNKLHEPRTSPDAPGNLKNPTRYSLLHSDVSVTVQPNRLGISAGGSLDRYDFDNTPLLGGGVLNNQDRNRDQYGAFAKVFYDFAGGYSAFVKASYDDRSYDLKIDRGGVNRSSHGYRVDGGVDLFLTHLLRGELFVGYLNQSYKAPLTDVSGLDFGATLNWYATPVATFHLTASRMLNDTTITGASTSDDRSVGGGVDYELMRNLIAQVSGSYTDSQFKGSVREDKVAGAHVGVKYLLNRYMAATAGYDYGHRNSSIAGQDYSDNTFSVGLHFQM